MKTLANVDRMFSQAVESEAVFLSQVLPFFDDTAIGLAGTFETEVYGALA
jgi:hypothetical protein